MQAEEDVNDRLDCSGYVGLRTELGDILTKDGIILIIEGDDHLDGMAEMLGGCKVPMKNTKSMRGRN